MKLLKKQTVITIFTMFILFHYANAQFGKANKIKIPDTYDFTWTMKMDMKNKKGVFEMEYFLKEDAKYFGFKNDMIAKQAKGTDMFMVMDVNLEVNSIFMEMMGRKIIQKSSLKGLGDSADNGDDFTYKQIESKTILGYKCDGFQAESDEHLIRFFITNEVPVSFTQLWGADKKTMPKGFNSAWIKKYADNGAVLEMQFEDKKKSKNNTTMICTAIEKTDFSINTTEYKSMF